MRVLLETNNAIVGFDEQKKYIMVIWSSDPNEKEFSRVYNCVLKAFKIYFVDKLINDFARFSRLTPCQSDFLSDHIFPLAHKCGMRELINVGSNSGIIEGFTENIESLFTNKKHKLVVHMSDNFEEAMAKIRV